MERDGLSRAAPAALHSRRALAIRRNDTDAANATCKHSSINHNLSMDEKHV